MGAYAPENSCFLTIPTSLGAYAPEKVPRSHFFAIFDLPIFTYCYLPWWIPDIYLDFKRKRFLFGSRIYFRKVGGYAPDYPLNWVLCLSKYLAFTSPFFSSHLILSPLFTGLSIVNNVTSFSFTAPKIRHSLCMVAICSVVKFTTAVLYMMLWFVLFYPIC